MAADFNVIKTAAVAVFAVISTVVNVASDVSVCIVGSIKPCFFDGGNPSVIAEILIPAVEVLTVFICDFKSL